jgi:hypothetical protein
VTAAAKLWRHIFGDRRDVMAIFSGLHVPGKKDLEMESTQYFSYPEEIDKAEAHAALMAKRNREVYFCAHLLLAKQRRKDNASALLALYADNDSGELRPGVPPPTARLRSSPGRTHDFWRLSRPVRPDKAEELNKRLTLAMQADPSGYDLTQVLRVPGTPNHKYAERPVVQVISIDDTLAYDPDDLDRILPKLPKPASTRQPIAGDPVDPDDEKLIEHGLAILGPAFRRLWEGDASDYADREHPEGNLSRADWGLAKDLLRLTGGDVDRAERLAERSGLVREKWEEPHAGDGRAYLRLTLDNALEAGLEPLPVSAPADPFIGHDGDQTCRNCPTLDQELTQIKAVLRSGLPAGQRIAVVGALTRILEAERRSPGERHVIRRWWIAKDWNVSEDVVGQAVDFIAKAGVIDKTVDYELVEDKQAEPTRTVQHINQATGEITELRKGQLRPRLELRAKPLVARPDAWKIVAQAAPTERPKRAAPGSRQVCPLHPDTELEHQPVCPECRLPLGEIQRRAEHVDHGFQPAPALCAEKSAIGATAPPAPPGVALSVQTEKSAIGERPLSGEPLELVRELLILGGRLGWPAIRVNGGHVRGRDGWETLASPSALTYLPDAIVQAREIDRMRSGGAG